MSSFRLPSAFGLSLFFSLAACGGSVVIDPGGSGDSGTDGGTTTDATPTTCDDPGKCGPMPDSPSERCADGSTGGFTGRCISTGGGSCGWEYRSCPDTKSCGGTSTGKCAATEFCSHPVGACLGDITGTCLPKPTGCGKNLQPTCGCDGVTYGNPCLAAAAGMSVKHEGTCDTGIACGGGEPPVCGPGMYCHFPDDTCAPGATGVCETKPTGCPDIYAPVCSCDGKTYSNSCEAASFGASIAFKGECPAPPSGKSCGGFVGATCAKDEYCDYPDSYCGGADGSGTCYRRPGACDPIYDPVCGCDGRTYSSPCAAHAAGQDDATKGPCSK